MHFSKPIIQFIENHREESPSEIAFKAKSYPDWPMQWIASQVAGWQVAKDKVPSWASLPTLCYPPKLSLEQCSSELTAKFKASLHKGKRMADLTGGWGVDTYFLSDNFEEAYHVERSEELHQIAKYNFEQLKASHIQCLHGEADSMLDELPPLDLIYIDPARRDALQRKVFELSHCEPDITALLPKLLTKAETILLKASPMLDIPQTIKQLKHVHQVWTVAVRGECKEVLFELKAPVNTNPKITAVNLTEGQEPSMPEVYNHFEQEKKLAAPLSNPLGFLYEPHAAIMKAGLFNTTAHRSQTSKLHTHTHLYTSANKVDSFPGRSFQILEVLPYNKKALKRKLPKKANVSIRNFPQTVAKTRQQLGIKDGGEEYLFFTTLSDASRVVIRCQKIKI